MKNLEGMDILLWKCDIKPKNEQNKTWSSVSNSSNVFDLKSLWHKIVFGPHIRFDP